MSPQKDSSRGLFVALLLSTFGVLGVTLWIYATPLNPGIPIVLGGALATFWAGIRGLRGIGPSYHWTTEVAILLGLWMALSSFTTLDAYLTARSVATFAGAIGFLLAVQCGCRSVADWRGCVWGVIGLSSLVCLLAWPAAFREALQTGDIPAIMGTFNNPDVFAVIPMAGLVLGLALLESAVGGARIWLLSQLAFLFVTLTATGCRAAVVGLGAGTLVFFLSLASKRKSHLGNLRFLLAVPLLVLIFFLPAANLDIPALDKWARSVSSHTGKIEEVRLEVLSRSWRAVALRPWIGAGAGAFGFSYQQVRSPDRDQNEFINLAHNDFIEVTVENGLPGLALWMLLWASAVRLLWERLKSGRRPVEAAGALASLAALATFSLFNFIISERPVLWLEFLVLGLAISFPTRRARTEERKPVRFVASLLVIALGGWSIWFGASTLRADLNVLEAEGKSKSLLLEDAARALDKAIALQPNRASIYQKRADVSMRLAAFSGDRRHDLACVFYLDKARSASPANIGVLIALSDALGRLGENERQKTTLEAADRYAPGHAAVRERIAAAAIRRGDYRAASVALEGVALRHGGLPLEQLASLTLALETETPGEGRKIAERLQGQADTRRAKEYFDFLLAECLKQKHWAAHENLANLRLQATPEDLCLWQQLAESTLNSQGLAAEFEILDSAVKGVENLDQICALSLLERWVAAGSALNRSDMMANLLAELIRKQPDAVAPRIALSELLRQEGKSGEGLAVLKQSLERSPYSYELLMQAGKLYESGGTLDLARNSYREALNSQPNDQAALEAFSRLNKR